MAHNKGAGVVRDQETLDGSDRWDHPKGKSHRMTIGHVVHAESSSEQSGQGKRQTMAIT